MSRPFAPVVLLVAVTAGSCGRPAPPPLRHVADVKQLMANVLDPAADGYWEGVGTIIDASGTWDIKPETNAEWDELVHRAYVITETGNLLMMGTRPKDGGEWMQLSRALVDVGEKAIQAAASHNPQAVFDVGAEVYEACTNCHAKYVPEIARPNSQD